MTIDALLQMPLDALLAAFFNTAEDSNGNFEIVSDYRTSKFLELPSDSHAKTAKGLSEKYGLSFELKSTSVISAQIENDKNWTLDQFLDAVYKSILPKLNKLSADYPLDTEIALALFIFRGSVDFNRNLYAVDWKNPTQQYLDNFFKLLLSSDDLLNRLNLNFRELQPQFVAGERQRNTQIRINLKWFYDNVISRYGNINEYKSDILQTQIVNLGEVRNFTSFEDRLVFYKQSILGRGLTESEINILRQDLEFSKQIIAQDPENKFAIRNQKIVSFARETFDDICVGCNDIYKIDDRSFKMPRNDRYYFEINHVIAYANDSDSVDVLDNLVKLCPACHRALTPNRAYPEYQKAIIEKMLASRPEVANFVESMMTGKYPSPVEYVYQSLK
ncbi:MAG: HNH endonuclease [Alphaproteobacteria bacterium]|nr:HNH endonuclease [Alphaproteobacteria bacterium]